MKSILFVFLVFIIFVPDVSSADEKVFYVPLRADPSIPKPIVNQIDEMLQSRISTEFEVKVIQKISLKDSAEIKGLKAVKRGKKILSKGRNLYIDVKLVESEGEFRNAIDIFEKHLAYMDNTNPFCEAVMNLAMAHEALGKIQDSDKFFARVAQLNPDYKPDEGQISPNVVSRFKMIAEREAKQPRVSLSVVSSPALAKVIVDGKKIGTTPLSGVKLPHGAHGLKIIKKGYKSHYERIELQEGKLKDRTVTLSTPSGATQLAALKKSIDNEAAAEKQAEIAVSLGIATETKRVLFGRLRKHKEKLLLVLADVTVDEKKVPKTRASFVDADLLTAPKVVKKLVSSLPKQEPFLFIPGVIVPPEVKLDFSASLIGASKAVKETPEMLAKTVAVEEAVPVYKKWWFWTIIGAVTAGAATTAIILATSGGGDDGKPDEKPDAIQEADEITITLEF